MSTLFHIIILIITIFIKCCIIIPMYLIKPIIKSYVMTKMQSLKEAILHNKYIFA